MKNCDMCGSEIIDQKCSCGQWITKKETQNHPLKKALDYFHNQNQMILTSDSPHLGCAAVFFRGDYNDCMKISEFIKKMKNRPFYE